MKVSYALYFFLFALGAFFAGETGLWGLAHAAPVAHLLLLVAALAAIAFVVQTMRGESGDASHGTMRLPRTLREGPVSIAVGIAAGLAALPLLHYFRMKLFLPPPQGLGDSLQLLENIPVFAQLFGYLDSFDDMLSIYLRSKSYLLLSGPGTAGLPAEVSLGLPSTLAGGFYISMVWLYLKGRSLREILLGLALLVMNPALQLYLGYVENYTLVSLYMTLILLLGMQRLGAYETNHARTDPLLLSTGAAAGFGLLAAWALLHHVVAAYLLPPLVYLVYVQARGRDNNFHIARFRTTALIAGGSAAVLLAAFWSYFLFFSDNPIIFSDSHVAHPPILPPRKVFSTRHVLNVFNQFIFAAPVALLVLAPHLKRAGAGFIAARGAFRSSLKERLLRVQQVLAPDRTAAFLGIAVLALLIDAFLHNPVIGYPADWDLMTRFGIPLNLYALHMFAQGASGKHSHAADHASPMSVVGIVLCLAFSSVLTTAWIARNASGGPASRANVERARKLVQQAVGDISASPAYGALKSKLRRKQYVRMELFILRSEMYLSERGDREAREILVLLQAARPRVKRVMQLPDHEYQPSFSRLWNDLAQLNQRISNLKAPL